MSYKKLVLSFLFLGSFFFCFIQCQNQGGSDGSSSGNDSGSQSDADIIANAVVGETKETSCDDLNILPSLKNRSTCFWLGVPESRNSNSDSENVIALPVVIIRSKSQNPDPDPIVFLGGGTGFPSINPHSLDLAVDLDFNRDLILMDQRGVGLSKPSLLCNNSKGNKDDDSDDNDFDDNDDNDDDLRDEKDGDKNNEDITFLHCNKKIRDKGIDLSSYNTKENAADFAELAEALDIEKVNYYGISYGSRVALELLRNHPDHVRSVILDGILPPHIHPISQTNQGLWETLIRVTKDCTENTACNQRYSDTSNGLDFFRHL